MLYTGYYAYTKKYKEAGLVTVAISGVVPSFYEGYTVKEFAPRKETFNKWKNGELDNFGYTNEYREHLNSLNKEYIKALISDFLKEGDVIFLCYEKSGEFCHRHILADWLENTLQVGMVDEYKVK